MDKNSIKKALYIEKPQAVLVNVNKTGLNYLCELFSGITITFFIPMEDIGDAIFETIMPSQLLIRWIVIPETV